MPNLSSSNHFRSAQNLDFCYLCSQPLKGSGAPNRDHVPPQAVFLERDRNPALWLPTHTDCNLSQSREDDKIGQLMKLLHRKQPSNPNHRVLKYDYDLGAVDGIDIERIVFRWVRGFHAALYGQPLDCRLNGMISTPFVPVDRVDRLPLPVNKYHALVVREIKKNRAASCLDSIRSSNGKCRYECVWGKTGDNVWCCLFALELYNWIDLARSRHSPTRGCCGYYFNSDLALPPNATVETSVTVPFSNLHQLDPFGP